MFLVTVPPSQPANLHQLLFQRYAHHRHLHSFPTRRSSDLSRARPGAQKLGQWTITLSNSTGDRKSTRLNSSHGYISYAVFCLKKKKTTSSVGRKLASAPSR